MNKIIWITVGLILITTSIVGYFISFNGRITNTPDKDDSSNGIAFEGHGIQNLTLNVTLPDETVKLSTYTLSMPSINLSVCKDLIVDTFPGWLNENIQIRNATDGSSTLFIKGDERISITKSGGLTYFNNTATQRWNKYWQSAVNPPHNGTHQEYTLNETFNGTNSTLPGYSNDTNNNTSSNYTNDYNQSNDFTDINYSANNNVNNISDDSSNDSLVEIHLSNTISIDEAWTGAIQFIKKHGDLPENYYQSYRNAGNMVIGNKTFEYDYTFHVNRKIEGYPIIGRGGEGARISMTPLGDVPFYQVLWRTIGEPDKTITTVNASSALSYIDSKIQFPGNSTRLIEKVELGYYSEDFKEQQDKLKPVWIFYTDIDYEQYICVDAVGLKYYDY